MLLQKNQKGMTFLGYVIVLSVIGFFAIMAMKLAPLYLEYQSVVKIMNNVAEESTAATPPATLRDTIQKRLDVNDINRIKARDFKIERDKGTTRLSISYEARTQFLGNLWFLLTFEHSVDLRGA